MRKILIDDNLKKIAHLYSENPFKSRRKDFILPINNLEELSSDLRGFKPQYSNYIDEIIKEYQKLNELNPSEVSDIKAKFDSIVGEADLSLDIPEKDNRKLYELIVEAMRYEDLRERDFLPYLKIAGIKSCVYCNSQLTIITEINDSTSKVSAKFEFDHHFPQSKYPFLCTSYFNLYPCCSNCNKVKSSKDAKFELYTEDENELDVFKFSIDDESVVVYINNRDIEALKFKFESIPGIPDFAAEHDKMFGIQGVYNTQKDIVAELIHKKEAYTELYKKELVDTFHKLFPDTSLINRLLVGNYDQPSEVHKRPLAKFMQDIWMDLNKS